MELVFVSLCLFATPVTKTGLMITVSITSVLSHLPLTLCPALVVSLLGTHTKIPRYLLTMLTLIDSLPLPALARLIRLMIIFKEFFFMPRSRFDYPLKPYAPANIGVLLHPIFVFDDIGD